MNDASLTRRRLLAALGVGTLSSALPFGALPAFGKDACKLKVVTTIFPPYDFVKTIGGDRVCATLLLKPGQEAHTYEPTPADIRMIQSADLFVYTGGENDTWVEGLLDSLGDKSPQSVRLIDMVATVPEEIVEGMEDDDDHDHAHGKADEHDHDHAHEHNHEHEHEHEHEHDHHHDEDKAQKGSVAAQVAEPDHHGESNARQEASSTESAEDDDPPADEHVWTSPKNAVAIVEALKGLLIELDHDGAAIYNANAAAYVKALNALDAEYRDMVAHAKRHTILVADRFPFRYLAEAYGLKYYAAFPGCSTQVRPSAATVAFLVDKVSAERLPVVLRVANDSPRIAQAVAEPSKAKVLELHALHNLTPQEFKAGLNYLTVMRANLEILRKALNE